MSCRVGPSPPRLFTEERWSSQTHNSTSARRPGLRHGLGGQGRRQDWPRHARCHQPPRLVAGHQCVPTSPQSCSFFFFADSKTSTQSVVTTPSTSAATSATAPVRREIVNAGIWRKILTFRHFAQTRSSRPRRRLLSGSARRVFSSTPATRRSGSTSKRRRQYPTPCSTENQEKLQYPFDPNTAEGELIPRVRKEYLRLYRKDTREETDVLVVACSDSPSQGLSSSRLSRIS
jgi:hypothetical protein